MRRALSAGILVVTVLGFAALAHGGYMAVNFKGAIDPKGDSRPLAFTYEKLSADRRLVADATIRNLTVDCFAPGSDEPRPGELRVFHQPSPAWAVNRKKKIRGPRDFGRTWNGKDLPIAAPEGDETRFVNKHARFAGNFRKGFKRARGTFEIRWTEVDKDSGEELYACGIETNWRARAVKRKR